MIDAKKNHNTSPEYQAAVVQNAVTTCGSLKALAEKVGVTYDYITKLRLGKRCWTYSLQCLMENIAKGKTEVVDPPKTIKVANSFCAVPNRLGGIIIPRSRLPAVFLSNPKYAEVVLPVSLSAAKWDLYRKNNPNAFPPFSYSEENDWIVVKYKGKGIAMTIREAKIRGLSEENNWFPDFKEWADSIIAEQHDEN